MEPPGLAPGIEYDHLISSGMNEAGLVGFRAVLQGPGVEYENDGAIFAHGLGGLSLIVRESYGVPGRPQDTWGHSGGPLIRDDARLMFFNRINGDDTLDSLWTGWAGFLSEVVVAGEGPPGVNEILGYSQSSAGTSFITIQPYGMHRDLGNGIVSYAVEGTAGPIGTWDQLDIFQADINAAGDVVVIG